MITWNLSKIDKLNYNKDPQAGGDGFFDFIPGLTVDQQNGRLIFTTVEPFGKTIFEIMIYRKEKVMISQKIWGNQVLGFSWGIPAFSAASTAAELKRIDKNKILSINLIKKRIE